MKDFDRKFFKFLGLEDRLNFYRSAALFKIALKRSHNKQALAEDIFMDVVSTIYKKTKQENLPMDKNLIFVAMKAIKNKTIDKFRYQQTRDKYQGKARTALYSKSESPEELLLKQEELLNTADCLTKIGEFCEKLLKFVGIGKKQKEIAIELSISQGEVAKKKKECLKKLNILEQNN